MVLSRILVCCLILTSFLNAARAEDRPVPVNKARVSISKDGDPDASVLAFSTSGRWLAAGFMNGRIKVYDVPAKRWSPLMDVRHKQTVNCVAFTPDHRQVVSGGYDDTLVFSDIQSGNTLKTLHLPTHGIMGIAFSSDGRLMAAASLPESEDENGKVTVWSYPSLKVLHVFDALCDAPDSIAFSHSGDRFVIGGNIVSAWTVGTGKCFWKMESPGTVCAAISPDGHRVICRDGMWDVDTRKRISDEEWFGQQTCFGFSSDGSVIMGGSEEDGVTLWEGKTGKKIVELDVYADWLALSPNAKLLATGTDEVALITLDMAQLRGIAYRRAHPTAKEAANRALFEALKTQNTAGVAAALAHGADPKGKINGNGPPILEIAARCKSVANFQLLLKAGAHFNPSDSDQAKAFLKGAFADGGEVQMLKFLVSQGVKLPPKGSDWSLMIDASISGNVPIIQYLLDNGADIEDKDPSHRYTPLLIAAANGKTDAVKLLLVRGADPKAKDEENGATVFQNAVFSGNASTVKALLFIQPDMNEKDRFGTQLGELCVPSNHFEVLAILLDNGLDAEQIEKDGRTLLMDAALRDEFECVSLLLAHGADPTRKNKVGQTALDLATSPKIETLLKQAIAKSLQK